MDDNYNEEDMREARDIVIALYNAAHSLACDDPDCPWAHLFNEPSELTNEGNSPHDDALILVLLGLLENIDECLDLIRLLVANRNETSGPDHLTQSSTISGWSMEDMTTDTDEALREPPVPGLYHDQWTQTPAVSPPAYTAFFHSYPEGSPRAPASSPASETQTPSDAGTPVIDNQEGVSRGDQRAQD